jgi:hypothetical protein
MYASANSPLSERVQLLDSHSAMFVGEAAAVPFQARTCCRCALPAAHLEAEVFDACGLQQLVEVPEEVAGSDGLIMELRELKHVDGSEHRLIEVLPAGDTEATCSSSGGDAY